MQFNLVSFFPHLIGADKHSVTNSDFVCVKCNQVVQMYDTIIGHLQATKKITVSGPAEPVRSVRPWPDQLFGKIIKFLFLLGIFKGLGTSEAFYQKASGALKYA